MLKETKTEETIDLFPIFIIAVISIVEDPGLLGPPPAYACDVIHYLLS